VSRAFVRGTRNTASLSASGTASAAILAGAPGGTIAMGSNPITLTYDGTHPALTVTGATLSWQCPARLAHYPPAA